MGCFRFYLGAETPPEQKKHRKGRKKTPPGQKKKHRRGSKRNPAIGRFVCRFGFATEHRNNQSVGVTGRQCRRDGDSQATIAAPPVIVRPVIVRPVIVLADLSGGRCRSQAFVFRFELLVASFQVVDLIDHGVEIVRHGKPKVASAKLDFGSFVAFGHLGQNGA